MNEKLVAPFPYFGGKQLACDLVWSLLGDTTNYVEPFAGSAAMLLGRPTGVGHVETINDYDGFVSNFWRAIANDPDGVAFHADWPTNENDLFARHSWLVRHKSELNDSLHDPDYYSTKIAGWWVWGMCNWIGPGFCGGSGPWVWDGEHIVNIRKIPHLGNNGRGINRQIPHLSSGRGINRQIPHLNSGLGINRQIPHLDNNGRGEYISGWFNLLYNRMRDVRVVSGDWKRVLSDSVTIRHRLTGIFLDPPYDKGSMDYGNGGMNEGISKSVREWCIENYDNKLMRIVICGHAGEHDELLSYGWTEHKWVARRGYAITDEAIENYNSETVWASPHCLDPKEKSDDALLMELFV